MDNSEIRYILEDNLSKMIFTKISGVSETMLEFSKTGKATENYSDSEMKRLVIFSMLNTKLDDSDNPSEYIFAIDIKPKDSGTDKNDKKFQLIINIKNGIKLKT